MKAEIAELLEALAQVSGINCVVSGDEAVAELFFNAPGQVKLSFLDGWGTFECATFHIHFKSVNLDRVRFVDEAGSCVERATYLTLYDLNGQERLQFYFPNPGDNSRPYTADELALFEQFRARFGHLQ